MERISVKTLREFSEKSHRKLVRFGQQNRNAELKLIKFGTTEIYQKPKISTTSDGAKGYSA